MKASVVEMQAVDVRSRERGCVRNKMKKSGEENNNKRRTWDPKINSVVALNGSP